jgi:hypothetical protein
MIAGHGNAMFAVDPSISALVFGSMVIGGFIGWS